MKILNFNQSEADVQFTIDEIIILKNAFNEVFNGIKIIDFESEIGVSREQFKVLFQLVKYLLKDKSLIRDKKLTSYKVDNSHHKYAKKSNRNFILKEKLCLKTEGYQVIFYLKNLDDCKNYVGVVIVLILCVCYLHKNQIRLLLYRQTQI